MLRYSPLQFVVYWLSLRIFSVMLDHIFYLHRGMGKVGCCVGLHTHFIGLEGI